MFLEKPGLLIELVWWFSVGRKNVPNLVTCWQTALMLWRFDCAVKPKNSLLKVIWSHFIIFLMLKRNVILHFSMSFFNHLITIDKAVFNAQMRRYRLVHVYFAFVRIQRWQLCYQRLFRRLFCESWLSSSCLLIGSVWLLHHMGGEMGSCWCNIVFALRLK